MIQSLLFLVSAITLAQTPAAEIGSPSPHVWEKVEIPLQSQRQYENPYRDVQVWVDLQGPGFEKRCYGFWDGGSTFRVRVLATAPGRWTWKSGASVADAGLRGVDGGFTAVEWTEAELAENPCRRGMIRPTSNGHAFEHSDGTPFFLLGDTWWATPTFRFRWDEDDAPRPIGPGAGFKDFVRYRRNQQFNCIAMIAAFPNWANDGEPARWNADDGMVLRSAWPQAGTESAKEMTDEAGRRAFQFPGAVPGYEKYFPNLNRIQPEYFHSLDKKVDYLNAQGMIPFIEVARRDIGQMWKRYYPWPDSYTRYIQYVWSRYQANICLFSPIHFDTPAQSITMEDSKPGSDKAARYCRSAMYGSVLSGGLGGHIYGAGGWKGGLWSGEVEAASEYPIWEVLQWPSADQLRHLKTFVLSEGRRYQDLVPTVELLSPSRSGKEKSLNGWSYCAATPSRNLLFLYFEQDCPRGKLSGLPAGRQYSAHWFDPRTGHWLEVVAPDAALTATANGTLRLPPFPGGEDTSVADWALKLLNRSE